MGKNLKGKECGKGICQRKDGKYSARFCGKNGVRKEKHFSTLPEARNWLADQQYNDRHDLVVANSNMTVDAWFKFWLNHLICDLAPNTIISNPFLAPCQLQKSSQCTARLSSIAWIQNMRVQQSGKRISQWVPCFVLRS